MEAKKSNWKSRIASSHVRHFKVKSHYSILGALYELVEFTKLFNQMCWIALYCNVVSCSLKLCTIAIIWQTNSRTNTIHSQGESARITIVMQALHCSVQLRYIYIVLCVRISNSISSLTQTSVSSFIVHIYITRLRQYVFLFPLLLSNHEMNHEKQDHEMELL